MNLRFITIVSFLPAVYVSCISYGENASSNFVLIKQNEQPPESVRHLASSSNPRARQTAFFANEELKANYSELKAEGQFHPVTDITSSVIIATSEKDAYIYSEHKLKKLGQLQNYNTAKLAHLVNSVADSELVVAYSKPLLKGLSLTAAILRTKSDCYYSVSVASASCKQQKLSIQLIGCAAIASIWN